MLKPTMLRNLFIRFFKNSDSPNRALGRWGYHWEQKIKYQSYYD
jgi:hypothetical protein